MVNSAIVSREELSSDHRFGSAAGGDAGQAWHTQTYREEADQIHLEFLKALDVTGLFQLMCFCNAMQKSELVTLD